MRTLIAIFATAMLATAAHAEPAAKNAPAPGKALHEKSCTNCHANMYGGDGTGIYTRADRKTRTAQQLATRVSACNINTGAGWFPEDEAHVAAYLNQQFYKF